MGRHVRQMQPTRLLPALVAGLLLAALPHAAAQEESVEDVGVVTPTTPGSVSNDLPCLDLSGAIDAGEGLSLGWEAAEGAQNYTVHRISEESIDFEARAVIDAAEGTTAFEDTLEPYVFYGYAVTVDGASPWECQQLLIVVDSENGCFQPGYCPPCPEPVATALPDGGIQVEWNADARVVEWAVLRATEPDGAYELAGLVEGNVTVFVDEDVEAGQTYYYVLGGLSDDDVAGFCEAPIAVTAVPFFGGGALGIVLAGVGAVGAFVVMRRRA